LFCTNNNSFGIIKIMAQEPRKTAKMLNLEKKIKRELEYAIPELVNLHGLTGAANELGVGKATLSYWMLKLDIEYRKVALAPGESIEIRRLSG
jgi:hypothetical protein